MNRIKAVLQKCWQYEIVHAAVYSALLNMLVECFNRRSLIGLVMIFTNPVLFLYNTLIILVTMSVVLLFHRKVFVYCTVSVVWLLLAITNFVVLCSRKTPFTAMDIYLIEDAIKVIPVYLNAFQIILIVLAVAAGTGMAVDKRSETAGKNTLYPYNSKNWITVVMLYGSYPLSASYRNNKQLFRQSCQCL